MLSVLLFHLTLYINEQLKYRIYEGVSRSFRTGRLVLELQVVELSATRCSFMAILWVSLGSFAAITLCVASQLVFIVIVVYFFNDSVRKLLDTLSYHDSFYKDESSSQLTLYLVAQFQWLNVTGNPLQCNQHQQPFAFNFKTSVWMRTAFMKSHKSKFQIEKADLTLWKEPVIPTGYKFDCAPERIWMWRQRDWSSTGIERRSFRS
jgi:hypothetical protein